jgi:hypothetical protein
MAVCYCEQVLTVKPVKRGHLADLAKLFSPDRCSPNVCFRDVFFHTSYEKGKAIAFTDKYQKITKKERKYLLVPKKN